MKVVYHSSFPGRIYCYARVIQETCNASAADLNVLKTVIYYAKFSGRVSRRCALGECIRESVYYRIGVRCITSTTVRYVCWVRIGPTVANNANRNEPSLCHSRMVRKTEKSNLNRQTS